MLEMTTESVVVVPGLSLVRRGETVESFFHVTMSECCKCYSLQPCVSDSTTYRCADWRSCRVRQDENKLDTPRLTPADYAGLLDRMETQHSDMERLKRIEAAANSFAQASEAFDNVRGHGPVLALLTDQIAAEKALIAVVKGGRK